MNAPTSANELKAVIDNMLHRERFVFEPTPKKTVEVYNTILENSVSQDRNICVTILFDAEKAQTKSKLHRLWKEEDFERLFKAITQH